MITIPLVGSYCENANLSVFFNNYKPTTIYLEARDYGCPGPRLSSHSYTEHTGQLKRGHLAPGGPAGG